MITLFGSNFYWMGNNPTEQAEDLCLHGQVSLAFDGITIEDNCTVSASAMQFLRTLTEDHIARYTDEQMMPCCGHFMVASADGQTVYIGGCANGTDFDVLHRDGAVVIRTKDAEFRLDPDKYRTAVLHFAAQVEGFYTQSPPRALARHDQFAQNGYAAFWREWSRRKTAAE